MRKKLCRVRILTRVLIRVIYLWYWWIPLNLGLLALVSYFALIYLLYGTIEMQELNTILGKNGNNFFWKFWLPFGIPILLSLGSSLYGSKGVKNNKLDEAIRFRNGQMRVKSDKEASDILRKTNYLDLLQNDESVIFERARKGFDAKYGTKPTNEIFDDLMNEDKYI
jgi:hypothetical protein